MKVLLATFLLVVSGYGQQKPVLKVTIDGWGVVWPQGKQNYITVWPDGTVKYLIRAKRGLPAQVTDAITDRQVDEIVAASDQLHTPRKNEEPGAGPVDYRLSVRIESTRGGIVEISHYDFDDPSKIAPEVYRLLCTVDSIRDEPYRLTKESHCK